MEFLAMDGGSKANLMLAFTATFRLRHPFTTPRSGMIAK
jgi:hypothetical protein